MAPLDQILDDIATALRRADYPRLQALSAMLETVLPPQDAATLQRAARLARQNEAMLQATAAGLRAARRRLAELSHGPRLTTYDGAGRKQNHAPAPAPAQRL